MYQQALAGVLQNLKPCHCRLHQCIMCRATASLYRHGLMHICKATRAHQLIQWHQPGLHLLCRCGHGYEVPQHAKERSDEDS